MSSNQIKFLEATLNQGVDAAQKSFPGVALDDELDLLRKMSVDQIRKLLELRRAAESATATAVTGSGVLSF